MHFYLHVQPCFDPTLTIVTMFYLWIITWQHDNLLFINFISTIWKPCHVTIGLFRPMTLLGTSWQRSWGPCLNCLVSLPRFVLCEKWRYSFGEHDHGFEVNDFMWIIDFALFLLMVHVLDMLWVRWLSMPIMTMRFPNILCQIL